MSSHAQRTTSVRNEASISQDVEAVARELFGRACRDESFEDLKRRAAFNRQDAGRLRHWIMAAQAVAAGAPRRS